MTDTARVSGGGRRKRGRSIDCIGLPRRAPVQTFEWFGGGCGWKYEFLKSNIKAETFTLEPYYRHLLQEASLGAGTAESGGSGSAASPVPMDMIIWADRGVM